jgi:hypothetical protein
MGRPNLAGHRKFRRLARELDSDVIARGCLEFLWESAYENGSSYLGDKDDVELAARWKGEPGKLAQALLLAGGDGNAGFIEEVPGNPGQFAVHDLFQHASDYVQKRRDRELARIQRGVTISDMRREAGKRGRALQLANVGQTSASVGQTADSCHNTRANGVTPAPAPAPAPAPKQNPLSEQGSDEEGPSPRRSKQPSQEACRLAALLKSEILRNKADFRITPAQERSWAVTAQRMINRDERDPREIEELIRWAQQDGFWMSNILSMDKLREKFDQLRMKCGQHKEQSQHGGSFKGSGKSVSERLMEDCRGLGITPEQMDEATR